MRCPHCEEKVGVFSKAVNRFGKDKRCPHCGKSIKVTVDWRRFAILIVPAIVLGIYGRSVLEANGMSGSLSTGLATGLLVLLSLRLNPGAVA